MDSANQQDGKARRSVSEERHHVGQWMQSHPYVMPLDGPVNTRSLLPEYPIAQQDQTNKNKLRFRIKPSPEKNLTRKLTRFSTNTAISTGSKEIVYSHRAESEEKWERFEQYSPLHISESHFQKSNSLSKHLVQHETDYTTKADMAALQKQQQALQHISQNMLPYLRMNFQSHFSRTPAIQQHQHKKQSVSKNSKYNKMGLGQKRFKDLEKLSPIPTLQYSQSQMMLQGSPIPRQVPSQLEQRHMLIQQSMPALSDRKRNEVPKQSLQPILSGRVRLQRDSIPSRSNVEKVQVKKKLKELGQKDRYATLDGAEDITDEIDEWNFQSSTVVGKHKSLERFECKKRFNTIDRVSPVSKENKQFDSQNFTSDLENSLVLGENDLQKNLPDRYQELEKLKQKLKIKQNQEDIQYALGWNKQQAQRLAKFVKLKKRVVEEQIKLKQMRIKQKLELNDNDLIETFYDNSDWLPAIEKEEMRQKVLEEEQPQTPIHSVQIKQKQTCKASTNDKRVLPVQKAEKNIIFKPQKDKDDKEETAKKVRDFRTILKFNKNQHEFDMHKSEQRTVRVRVPQQSELLSSLSRLASFRNIIGLGNQRMKHGNFL